MSYLDKVIIYTRPEEKEDVLKQILTENVKTVLHIPLIRTQTKKPDLNSISLLNGAGEFSWLVFTSGNGVKSFFGLINNQTINPSRIPKIAVFGLKTASVLNNFNSKADFVSSGKTSSDFAAEFKQVLAQSDSVLLLLGEFADDLLENELKSMCSVHRLNIYETISLSGFSDSLTEIISNKNYDLIVITSPSAVRSFLHSAELKSIKSEYKFACIGETTASEVRKYGYSPVLVSSRPDAGTFSKEIINYLNIN